MKKTTGSKRLFLSAEKIRDLQPRQLVRVAGGAVCAVTYAGDSGGGCIVTAGNNTDGTTAPDTGCKLTGASCAITGTL